MNFFLLFFLPNMMNMKFNIKYFVLIFYLVVNYRH
jgi:hypothetical protein